MATLATMLDRFTTHQDPGGARPRILADEDPFEVPAFPNEDVYLYVKHIDNSRILRETDPAARQSPWIGIVKFLLLVILIGVIFLIGQEMVRHRFFRGGWVDQHDVLKP